MKSPVSAFLICAALAGCAGSSDLEPSKSRPIAIDPVCGTVVDPSTPFTGRHRQLVYYFHSDDCRRRFASDPDYFAFGPYPDRGPRKEGNVVLFTDPVCGQETTVTRWFADYKDRRYYFHDEECWLDFRFEPQAFVPPEHQVEVR
jgi:YHS domain-containing protein